MAKDYTGPPATLGSWERNRIDVAMHCGGCHTSRLIPIGNLVAQLGADFPVPEVGKRLRCAACGHRGADVWASVRSTRGAYGAGRLQTV